MVTLQRTWQATLGGLVLALSAIGGCGTSGGGVATTGDEPRAEPVATTADGSPADDAADSGTADSGSEPSDTANPDSAAPHAAFATSTTGASSAADRIDASLVRVGGREDFEALLAEHRGKVVLVDFWAMWCGPCVRQFPHTVELSRKFADDGLAVITVNFDDPESSSPQVLEFLRKQNAALPTLISEYGVSTESAEQFEMVADGALPGYKLFDRSGQLRFQFSALPDESESIEPPDNIDTRVAQLLAE